MDSYSEQQEGCHENWNKEKFQREKLLRNHLKVMLASRREKKWGFQQRGVTWSCEWWYIHRRAAEVMLGALGPYAACRAFSTRAMALKWCSFQKLSRWGG